MNTALTEAIKQAYAAAKSNEVHLETLEIYHPLAGHFYIVKDRVDHDLTLETLAVETFEGVAFRFTLPPSGDNGLQELSLAIDNVDQRVSDFLSLAKESVAPVTVTYRPYLASDPTTPQMDPPLVLYLTDVTVTALEVTGKATFADVLNKKFPNDGYTRARFPSLAN